MVSKVRQATLDCVGSGLSFFVLCIARKQPLLVVVFVGEVW